MLHLQSASSENRAKHPKQHLGIFYGIPFEQKWRGFTLLLHHGISTFDFIKYLIAFRQQKLSSYHHQIHHSQYIKGGIHLLNYQSKRQAWPLFSWFNRNVIIYYISTINMRLQFSLSKIKIDPVCHIQIARHANQYAGKNVTGFLYGALYDDQASITNILPFSASENLQVQEDITFMERRHEEKLHEFNLDHENLGFYLISPDGNFWEELYNVRLFEEYINTSFFLVYDCDAGKRGLNPYRAFRLNDQFATTSRFTWANLQQIDLKEHNPFTEIPAEVQKSELFEALMLFNKQKFLHRFSKQREHSAPNQIVPNKIDSYLESLQRHQQASIHLNDLMKKVKKIEGQQKSDLPSNQFYNYIAIDLQVRSKQQMFKQYEHNLKFIEKALH